MAEDYDSDSPFEGMSHSDAQEFIYDIIGFLDGESYDQTAHSLFYDAMYNDELTIDERIQTFEDLEEYLYDEYGIFFGDYWDWDDFREWYASQ